MTNSRLMLLVLTISMSAGCGSDDDDGGSILPCPDDLIGFDGPGGAGCIEPYEVTNAEAVEFLADFGNECQGHPCIYVGEPGSKIVDQGSGHEVEAGFEDHPVVQITFHGAAAYCEWVGRALCGDGAWIAACGGPSQATYPYGGSYDAATCNGADAENDDTVDVGSLPGCEGGYTGLFDMSGNVYEWTDACGGGDCLIRGGSYDKPADDMSCDGSHTMDGPGGHREDLGVRCCAPPLR